MMMMMTMRINAQIRRRHQHIRLMKKTAYSMPGLI